MAVNTSYSGTPLAKKLGIKSGFNVRLVNAPAHYLSLFDDMPNDVNFSDPGTALDVIHFFTQQREEFLSLLPQLKNQIKTNGTIWVS